MPAPLASGARIALSEAQAHHLGVLRRAPGDMVRLFNAGDGEWGARIERLRKGTAEVTLLDRLRAPAPEPDIWLAFAPLKRDTTDWLVEKATELGATRLLPVLTERTNAARVNVERLAAVATAAAEQCERLGVPTVAEPTGLGALLAAWSADRPLFVAAERRDVPMARPCPAPAGLLVGPEGGFAPLELELAARHPFVHCVSLGPRVLRAETAAVVGLALLQAPAAR